MTWHLAFLIAGSAGLGFDPGLGTELLLATKHSKTWAGATTEAKHGANWGYTYGTGFTAYAGSGLQFGLGGVYYGYFSDFGGDSWSKQVYGPRGAIRYVGAFELEGSYTHGMGEFAQNSYEIRLDKSFGYWGFMLQGGIVGDGNYFSTGIRFKL